MNADNALPFTVGMSKTVDSGEVRKLVDRNDFQLKQLEPLDTRGNDLILPPRCWVR